MIKTVQELREELADAPDDMPIRICYEPHLFVGISSVQWMDEKCVLCTDAVVHPRKRSKLSIK